MGRLLKISVFVVMVLFAFACQKGQTPPAAAGAAGQGGGQAVEAPAAVKPDVADASHGFVIRFGLGLAEISEGNVKYVASLTLGEKVALTGQSQKAADRDFVEVTRDSGKTGWARADYVVANSMLGVVSAEDPVLFSEPKDTGATARSVPRLSILAVSADSADQPFYKVTVYDPASQVLSSEVYLESDVVSLKTDDVQSAILLKLAEASDKPAQKQAFLQSAAREHPGSAFILQIEEELAALSAPAPSLATEKFFASMFSTSDNVNVRDAPDESAGKVVASLKTGQAVEIEEKTTEEYTVQDRTAPWYRIKEPAGWVFGGWLATEE